MQSHICKVYVCLAVTCHLRFWQNDQGLLRATAVVVLTSFQKNDPYIYTKHHQMQNTIKCYRWPTGYHTLFNISHHMNWWSEHACFVPKTKDKKSLQHAASQLGHLTFSITSPTKCYSWNSVSIILFIQNKIDDPFLKQNLWFWEFVLMWISLPNKTTTTKIAL